MNIQSAIHRAWSSLRMRIHAGEEQAISAVLLGPLEYAAFEQFVKEQIEAGLVTARDIDDAFHGRPFRYEFAGWEVLASATPGIRFARVFDAGSVDKARNWQAMTKRAASPAPEVPMCEPVADTSFISGHRLTTGINKETGEIRTDKRFFSEFDQISRLISYSICKTQESHIREALVSLGWTPPAEEGK